MVICPAALALSHRTAAQSIVLQRCTNICKICNLIPHVHILHVAHEHAPDGEPCCKVRIMPADKRLDRANVHKVVTEERLPRGRILG